MSYDLHVIAPKRVPAPVLDAVIAGTGGDVTGSTGQGGTLVMAGEPQDAVEVDGPVRIEAEDVPDQANGAIGKAGWLIELSVRGGREGSWPNELAEAIARVTDGVVFDPQQDTVVWPPRWQAKDVDRRSQRIDVVEVVSYTAAGEPSWLATRLLEVLRTKRPDSQPRRYGEFEPYQHRFEGDGAQAAFVELWERLSSTAIGPSLTWSATLPCFGGSLSATGQYRQRGREDTPACVRISFSFDARSLHRKQEDADALVDFVVSLADHVESFYAAAAMEENVELNRGRALMTGETEAAPFPRASSWVGLPASPTWIAWFGPPYADLVRPAIPPGHAIESNGGILVRTARQPVDRSELATIFPPLPESLLARRTCEPGRWLADARYTLIGGPPSQPAEHIPELTR